MDRVTIIVDDIPPSNNRFIGQNGKNWEYSRYKKKWADLIYMELLRTPLSQNMPFKKALVDIHYIFPENRRRDPDNYSGKMLLDPLVTYQVIEDDTFKNIELQLSAEVKRKVRKTIITVTNLEEQE